MKNLFYLVVLIVLSFSCSSQQPEEGVSNHGLITSAVAQDGYQLPEEGTRAYEMALKPISRPNINAMLNGTDEPMFPKPEDVFDDPRVRRSFIFNMHSMKYNFDVREHPYAIKMLHEYVDEQYADLIDNREAFIDANLIERVYMTEPAFALL